MATAQLGAVRRVFDHVRARVVPDHGDGDLLRRWDRDRDQAAFADLVRRHGPMVLGVCRRVLGDPHAADDAFQATFLVLARKAAAVRPPGVLGPWLHGVAYRTALKARGRAFRRRVVEREYAEQASRGTSVPGYGEPADLAPLIDEQLNALPEKYRRPLVLCGLQGLGKAEAAARLGLPEGTVSSRLARARELLRDRLARRGVVVPAAALAAFLVPGSASAALPAATPATVAGVAAGLTPVSPTVLTLSHEVLHAMTLVKWKLLSAVAAAVALTGGGFGLYSATADDQKPGDKPAVAKPDSQKPDGQKPAKPGDQPDKPKPDARKPDKPKPDGEKPDKPKADGAKPDKPKPDGEKPKPEAGKPTKVGGQITGVDPAGRTVAVLRKRDNGVIEEHYKVAPGAKILVDGKSAELKDVPKGSFGSFVFGPGNDGTPPEIEELRVTGPTLTGLVVAVGPDVIKIDTKEGGAAPRAIKVTAETRVQVGKDPAGKLADLRPGDKVTVVLTTDGSAALHITGGGPRPDGDKPNKKPDGGTKPEGDKKPDGVKKPEPDDE